MLRDSEVARKQAASFEGLDRRRRLGGTMSHSELLDARITVDGYRTFRMLTYCVVYLAVLCSPVVALAAAFYGWKAIEIVLTR